MGEFVHKALGVDGVLVVVHPPPEPRTHRGITHGVVDQQVGDGITKRAFSTAGVEALEGEWITPVLVKTLGTDRRLDRLAGNAHLQANEIAVLVEAADKLALGDGMIGPMALVLFARPDHLDWHARHFLGDQRRLTGKVLARGAPTKAAAQIHAIDVAFVERQADGLGHGGQSGLRILGRGPDFTLVGGIARCGVQGLHGGMVLVGDAVDRLHLLHCTGNGRSRVARLVADEGLGRIKPRLQGRGDGSAVELGVRALVIVEIYGLKGGLGAPPGVGDDSHRVLHAHNLLHARHLLGLGGLEAIQLAANDGAILHGSVEHAWHLVVDAVDLCAVNLARLMQALHGLAGNGPVLRILERGLLRRLQLGGGIGHLAIGDSAVGGLVADHTLRDRALGDRHLPLVGSRLQEHHAGCCATLTHIDGGLADALATCSLEVTPDALAG